MERFTWNDVPGEVRVSIGAALAASRKRSGKSMSFRIAQSYIEAVPEAIVSYGKTGLEDQLLRILDCLTHWRGEEARAVKRILNDYVKGGINA
jgi:hypothetical protein